MTLSERWRRTRGYRRGRAAGLVAGVLVAGVITVAGAAPAWALPPDAPAQPSVVAVNAGVVVTFVAPADGGSAITGYTAACSSSDGGAAGSVGGLASPVTVTGLTNAKTYTCTVFATNADGDGPVSPASAAVVPSTVPDAPAQPSVVAGNATVVVTFVAPADGGSAITGYTAACSSSDGGAAGSVGGASSPITVTGLTNAKTYTCTVFATNGNGPGATSPASAAVVLGTVPDAPVQPSVVAGNASVVVTFVAPADGGSAITGYTAACSSSDGGAAGSVGGASSPITVTGLTNAKTYTCTVFATNGNGPGATSPASAAVVLGTVPDAPVQPSVVAGNASVVVTFVAPADGGSVITGYTAACSSSDGGAAGSVGGASSPITVTGLTNGNTYTCTVLATNANGPSASSAPSVAVIPSARPDAPAPPAVVGGNARITVTFVAPADGGSPITGFTASCTSSNGGAARSLAGASSPITVTGLTNGKTYTCTVLATNANGPGANSAPSAAVIPKTVPSRPVAPTVSVGNGRIVVWFQAPGTGGSPITSYRAHCGATNGGSSSTATGRQSPITVTGLTNGSTYICAIVAVNALGAGASSPVSRAVVPFGKGFRMFSGDGGVFAFGDSGYYGAATGATQSLVVGMATTRDGRGYWLVARDGNVFHFGDAGAFGSMSGVHLNRPMVGIAATPSGRGYWLVASDGGIFSFGDARFYGSTGNIRLNQPIVGMTSTASGHGYWFVAADGGVFAYGDARFFGSAAGRSTSVVGMATSGTGHGYWIAAGDGQVFGFGDARVSRSGPILGLRLPVMGIEATPDGGGYWMAGADGGLFVSGDAPYIHWPGPLLLRRIIRGISR